MSNTTKKRGRGRYISGWKACLVYIEIPGQLGLYETLSQTSKVKIVLFILTYNNLWEEVMEKSHLSFLMCLSFSFVFKAFIPLQRCFSASFLRSISLVLMRQLPLHRHPLLLSEFSCQKMVWLRKKHLLTNKEICSHSPRPPADPVD